MVLLYARCHCDVSIIIEVGFRSTSGQRGCREDGAEAMATSTMAVRATILKLEELQKDTAITKNIVACIHRILTLDQESNGHLQRLVAAMYARCV